MLCFPRSARWIPAVVLAASAVSGCGSSREDIEPSSSAGTQGIAAATSGAGGGDGSGGATSSTGAGDGGAGATVTGSTGGSPSASSGGDGGAPAGPGSGGGASTATGPSTSSGGPCGVDGDCWGDEPVACSPGCESEEIFSDCDDGELPATYLFCSVANDVLRTNVWAHIVDCLRDAGLEAQCDDAQGAIDACMAEAFDNACHTDDSDALCANFTSSCEGQKETFPTAECESEVTVLNDTAVDDYVQCFVDRGDTPCEDIHAICMDVALGN